jgi:hypothetical protein
MKKTNHKVAWKAKEIVHDKEFINTIVTLP